MNKFSSLCTLFVLLLSACSENSTGPSPEPPPNGEEVSFSQNILPIFSTYRCLGCHGGTSGLSVNSVANLLKGGDHGPAIVPGNSNSSILIQKISANPPFGARMPLGGPYMSDSTIFVIREWIDQGAKDN